MIFIVWIAFILLQQKTNVNLIKKVCENKDFFHVLMPFEDTKISELNQYQKPDKALFNIYADLGYSIKKIDGCRSIFHQFFNLYNIII